MYYTNSKSLRNKIYVLRGKASVGKCDIISLTETWMETANKNLMSEYQIYGYQTFHKNRKGRKAEGGACETSW